MVRHKPVPIDTRATPNPSKVDSGSSGTRAAFTGPATAATKDSSTDADRNRIGYTQSAPAAR